MLLQLAGSDHAKYIVGHGVHMCSKPDIPYLMVITGDMQLHWGSADWPNWYLWWLLMV